VLADDQLVDVEDGRVAEVEDEVVAESLGPDEKSFRFQDGEELTSMLLTFLSRTLMIGTIEIG
jgi:hypothetical protein